MIAATIGLEAVTAPQSPVLHGLEDGLAPFGDITVTPCAVSPFVVGFKIVTP